MIDELYAASAGRRRDRPDRPRHLLPAARASPGLSENISVRSIVGRFLEHSRIFRFGSDARRRRVLHRLGRPDAAQPRPRVEASRRSPTRAARPPRRDPRDRPRRRRARVEARPGRLDARFRRPRDSTARPASRNWRRSARSRSGSRGRRRVVVRRTGSGGREVALVHRPAYDDLTLPKGKLEPGGGPAPGSGREVGEETGLHCLLGPALGAVEYVDRRGRDKTVHYWAMASAGERLAADEGDRRRALAPVRGRCGAPHARARPRRARPRRRGAPGRATG